MKASKNIFSFKTTNLLKEELVGSNSSYDNESLMENLHPQATKQGVPSNVNADGLEYEGEIQRLRREKQILKAKIEKVKQEEENTRAYLGALEERIQRTEIIQKKMMSFLAKAVQDSGLIMKLLQDERSEKLEPPKKHVNP